MNIFLGDAIEKNPQIFFSFTGDIGKSEKKVVKDNWLGNVNVVVSDKKLQVDKNNDGVVDWYGADVRSVQDYYPFGQELPGRNFSAGDYKFGYNGKEKDDEIKGSGNSYDFGARLYDPRIGRPPSPDPLASKFPELSPYQYFSNNPIMNIDLDGLEGVLYDINFNGTNITTTKIQLEDAGSLGNGSAIRTNKGGSTTYFYGNEIPSGNGESFTKAYESKESKIYDDGFGNLTGGYGHKLTSGELKTWKLNDPVSESQMDTWFSSDFSGFDKMVSDKKFNLTQTQKDPLVDFAFNIRKADERVGTFTKEKGGDFFLSYMAGGSGLWKRRFGEKLLYEEGQYLKFDRVDSKSNKESLDILYRCNPPEPSSVTGDINPGGVELK